MSGTHIDALEADNGGREMVAICWCGWWPTETPVLVALRAHQDETGRDTEGEQ